MAVEKKPAGETVIKQESAFSDFGAEVDVEAPPADKTTEASADMSTN